MAFQTRSTSAGSVYIKVSISTPEEAAGSNMAVSGALRDVNAAARSRECIWRDHVRSLFSYSACRPSRSRDIVVGLEAVLLQSGVPCSFPVTVGPTAPFFIFVLAHGHDSHLPHFDCCFENCIQILIGAALPGHTLACRPLSLSTNRANLWLWRPIPTNLEVETCQYL